MGLGVVDAEDVGTLLPADAGDGDPGPEAIFGVSASGKVAEEGFAGDADEDGAVEG
jgi:hypothetical protein